MPRAGDQFPGRRGGNDVYSPRRGSLPFDDPLSAIGDTARQAGEGIKGVIDAALDPVLDTIYDLTGIDLHGIVDVATRFLSNIWGTNPDWLEGLMSSFDGTFKWLDDLNLWLDSIGLGGGTFDPAAAAEDFIDFILNPVGKLAPMVAGLIDALHIPGLDASKIVSGLFPQSMLDITSIGAGIVTGLLSAVNIPALDASKIVSGIFGTGVIPDLDAAKIVSGFLGGGRIPNLDASKVTTGIFPQSMLSITSIAASIVTGLLSAINIPGLDASKIVSGLFGQSQISGLSTDLNNRVTTNVFAASAQAGPNIVLDPAFEDTTIVRNFGAAAGSGYSTDQSHSGTHSFKVVSVGGYDELDLIPTPGGTFAQDPSKSLIVKPGDKWLVEGWVFPKSTNATNTTGSGFLVRLDDSKGVNATTYIWVGAVGAPPDPPIGVWTKASGYVTIPAGYDRLLPFWSTSNPTPVGNTYYIDDVDVHNETAVQNAINAFDASTTAGSNLVIGPDFEDTTIPRWAYHTGSVPGGGAYSTTVARSGTHSYSLTRQAGKQETFVWLLPGIREPGAGPNDRTTGIKVQPGQRFYLEAWYWSPVANNQAAGLNVALEVGAVDSFSGSAAWVTIEQHDNTAVIEGAWTKLSGYYTVPAGKDRLFPYVHSYQGAATSTNVYYFDDVIVREDITPTNSSGIQDLINGITNYLTGLGGSGWGQTSANNALAGAKQSIEQNAAAIQAMTTTQGGGAASGKSVVVNYNDYANGALPSTHTVALFGTNASTVSILNGRVHANMVGGGDYKYWEILYNATQTNTDYQLVGITLTSLMGSGFGSQATNWIKGRSNLAQTRYVYAEFRKDDFNNLYFRLVASTASGGIVWKDWTACPYATTAWLQCGTTGGARIYKVWVGNQVIWTHNEVGTLSDLGASNRYAGHGGIVLPTGPVGPGDVSQFAFYDNMPPATVGSGAIITRTATGSTQANAGATQYISNGDSFFNNLERKTDDITVDQVWGGFQVRDAGWYKLKASVKIAGAAYPDRITLRLLGASGTTPDQAKYGGREHARMLSGGAVSTPPRWIGDDWEVYLDANEYVYLGYDCAVLNVASVFTGEATGLQTYFSIARINKNQN